MCARSRFGRGDHAFVRRPVLRLLRERDAGSAGGRARLRAVAGAPGCLVVVLCRHNPTGEDAHRATTCASAPGPRRDRPGVPGVRRRRPLPPGRASTRTPSSCRTLLEGVGARRRAGRLRARSARASPARSTRSGRRARSRSQSALAAELALARRRTRCGRDAAATVAERDRLAEALRAAGLGGAGLVRELPARRPRRAGGRRSRPAARAAARGAHVRHEPLLRATSASARRRRADDDRLLARARSGRAGAPRRRPPGRGAAPPSAARRETDDRAAGSRSTAPGRAAVTTGIGFLDHMLTALSTHALIDLELSCTGDL